MIFPSKLTEELIGAGLDIQGVADVSDVVDIPPEWYTFVGPDGTIVQVMFTSVPDQSDTDTAAAVIAAHDPTDYDALVRDGAEAEAASVPDWASWTMAEASDWVETNVSDLASAKVALVAMAKMVVALRNRAFPGLQK